VSDLVTLLDRYRPQGDAETADIQRVRALTQTATDPYQRDLPLHVTASALIVHPPTARVLLRWHQRQQAWLQVGGHGDPGETDPLTVVRREAEEETGLTDLAPWPDAEVKQVVIVNVPPGKGDPVLHGYPGPRRDPPGEPARAAPLAVPPRGARPDLRAQPQGNPGPHRATLVP
jgi:8-oxo-dGTP pyrophosphatase MutT (NUDIX family)